MTTLAPPIDEVIEAVPHGCLIGGRWHPASDSSSFLVDDPATGAQLCEVADAGADDALAALDAAASALGAWASTPPRERAERLRAAFELVREQSDMLAALIVSENGKSLSDARAEVAYGAEFLRWYAEEAVRCGGEVHTAPSGAHRILVVEQPIGVSLLVTPWNFPLAMLTRKVGPALAAGCTVVCKPAPETPLTALALGQILADAGMPDGVVNIVPSARAADVVGPLLADLRVRKLSFTGSTEVGQLLLRQAAANIVSCSMELGGNAPFIVLDDADLDAAVAGAMVAKMRNGGEACTAANRFYVQRSVAREFADRFSLAMETLRIGNGFEEGVHVGPLISERERDKVADLVEQAVDGGARVGTGGYIPSMPGWFYPPTVLDAVAPDAPILRSEIFGPVAPLVAFDDERDMIAMANSSPQGLVSYVYTGDLARGLRIGEALECGMVGLNRGVVSDAAAPFGGVKQSGLGREGGHDGLAEYLEKKYIALQW